MGKSKLRKKAWTCVLALLMLAQSVVAPMPAFAGVVEAEGEYEIYPTPQSVEYGSGATSLTAEVDVSYGDSVDDYTKDRVEKTLAVKGLAASTAEDGAHTKLTVGVYGDDEVEPYKADLGAEAFFTKAGGETKYDKYILAISDNRIVIVGEDTDAAYYGVTTLKRIFEQLGDDGDTVRNLTVKDYADIEFRGFIEGYYGNPWSNEDRVDLMKFGGEIKMNQYIYAPKDDPLHKDRWRDLYDMEDPDSGTGINKVKEMAQGGNESKCFFVYALHPFGGRPVNLSDDTYDAEVQVVKNKFYQVIKYADVRQIAILEDDAAGETAVRMVRFLTDMQEWLEELRENEFPDLKTDLLYCPTCYMNTTHAKLTAIHNGVSGKIHFVMTGGTIWGHVSKTFSDQFYAGLDSTEHPGRRPYMWVNWPCNDNTKNSQIMGGHNTILHKDVEPGNYEGVILNPIQESEPSKVGIFTAADFCWKIWKTDEEGDRAWDDAFKYIDHMTPVETKSSQALREVAKHQIAQASAQPQTPFEESVELKPLLNAFQEKMDAGTLEISDANKLKEEFQKIYDASVFYMENGTNRRMASQMTPFLSCLRDMTHADVRLMDIIAALLRGDSDQIWAGYAGAKASYEQSKTHGFAYYGAGTLYAKAGRKYIEPFTEEVMKYVSKAVLSTVNPESKDGVEPYVIDSANVTSNKSAYGNNSLGNMVDGNDSTYFWTNSVAAKNDWIQLDLGEAKPIGQVRALVGAGGDDKWLQYHAAYSMDGNKWISLPSYAGASGTDTYIVDLEGITVRYLRLVNDAENSKWSKFSEFTVYPPAKEKEVKYAAAVSHIGDWEVAGGSEANLTDGDDATYVEYKERQGQIEGGGNDPNRDKTLAGDWLQLDLGTVKTVGRVRCVVGAAQGAAGNKWEQYHLEYSEDALNWVRQPSYSGTSSGVDVYTVNLRGARTRYIRLVNDSDKVCWVKFSEFSACSYVEGVEEQYAATVSHVDGWSASATEEAKMADGDYTTCVHYNVRQSASENTNTTIAGDWLQLDLGTVKTVGRVRAWVGGGDGDKWEQYHLEYSKDKENWTALDGYTGVSSGVDDYNVDLSGARARYVRLVNDASKNVWVKFSGFYVYSYTAGGKEGQYGASVSHIGDWGVASGPEANLTDGDDDTYVEYKERQGQINGANDPNRDKTLAGDWLQLDLGSVKSVGRVRCVVGAAKGSAGNKWEEYHLEYSKDGETWEKLEKYTGVSSGVDIYIVNLDGANARYIRLVNDKDKQAWVKFSEFSVFSYVANGSLYTNAADEDWDLGTGGEPDSYSIFREGDATLRPGEYVGMKLDRIHALKGITATGNGMENLTLQQSMNGVEWDAKDETGAARYIRLLNQTGEDITFRLTDFTVVTDEIKPMDLLEATVRPGEDGDARSLKTTAYWMDGKLETKATYCTNARQGEHILYDLGQEVTIDSLRVYVLDTATDYPRDAKIQVSMDKSSWTDVLTIGDGVENEAADNNTKPVESQDGKWIHDTVDVAYAYLENTAVGHVKARYLRLYFTAGYPWRQIGLNEIQINGGAYLPAINDPTFETDAKLKAGYEPQNLTDSDLTTAFSPDGSDTGYLIYNISENTGIINGVNILQSESGCNAKVFARTGKDDAGAGQWKELGVLDQSFAGFYTGDLDQVFAIKIEWENAVPMIYEIIELQDSSAVLDRLENDANRKLAEAESELAGANDELADIEERVSAALQAVNAAADGSVEKLRAEVEYYETLAQKNAQEAAIAKLEAEIETAKADLATVAARRLREEADRELDTADRAELIAQAEAKESEAETHKTAAEDKLKIAADKKEEQSQNKSRAESKQAELDELLKPAEYTVTFYKNDGTGETATATVEKDMAIRASQVPKWAKDTETHTFDGWYTDEACQDADAYDMTAAVTADLPLYAKWTEKSGNEDDEAAKADAEAKADAAINALKALVQANGSVGAGDKLPVETEDGAALSWNASSEHVTVGADGTVAVAEGLTEESDITFTVTLSYGEGKNVTKTLMVTVRPAQSVVDPSGTYTVTFYKNDGTGETVTARVRKNAAIQEAQIPEWAKDTETHTFDGWYTDEACQDADAYDMTAAVTADLPLYAKWTENGGGNEEDESAKAEAESKAEEALKALDALVASSGSVSAGDKLPMTTEDGAALSWNADSEYVTIGEDGTISIAEGLAEEREIKFTVTFSYGDGKIMAKSKTVKVRPAQSVAKYTVTFESMGGSKVKAVRVDAGQAVGKPSNPAKTGYAFGGWYRDRACTKAYDFSEKVTGDITLYAKWAINTYNITFNANGAGVSGMPGKMTKKYKETLLMSEVKKTPLRSGYKFLGWSLSANGQVVTRLSITSNVTLYAKWEESPIITKGMPATVGKMKYKVLDPDKKTVAIVGSVSKTAKNIKIGDQVTIKGVPCTIVQIGSKAFKNCKNLKSVTVGQNVTSIGGSAFSGCAKLSKLIFKGKKKAPKIGSKAFSGVKSKVTVTVPKKLPKKQFNSLKKALKSKGLKKTSYKKK